MRLASLGSVRSLHKGARQERTAAQPPTHLLLCSSRYKMFTKTQHTCGASTDHPP